MTAMDGARIHITGVVQGVGFRPFVFALANRMALKGWVRNTSAGVDIEIDGPREVLNGFVEALGKEAPPLSRIDEIKVESRPPDGFTSFEIVYSKTIPDAFQPISPDVSLCTDCLRELLDPGDRRFRYPFINCTNCGPRFTIIKDIPYDRLKTTMDPFEMCAECAAEYVDPCDRRFHAQPIACPVCGPQVWLEIGGGRIAEGDDAIQRARQLIKEGKVVALKGLGGFHLACDATSEEAVAGLRTRKLRVDKPFGLMSYDLETIETSCVVNQIEQALLESLERPIVILSRRPKSPIAFGVAPHQQTLGFMLPYTPLHVLLLEPDPGYPSALVMTSGNLLEEPIVTQNDEARERLHGLSDAILMHDRGIHLRTDDSVVQTFEDKVYPLRRSRGYAPFPVQLPWESETILAVGGEMKNTFCLTRDHFAFLSHHIGDMQNFETLSSFEQGIAHFERIFRIDPAMIAYDLHPDYMATRYALERSEREGIPAVGVQHHHAHICAAMVENGLEPDTQVLGVAFDGTGFGDDGVIWGGEFLLATYTNYERVYHLSSIPMPGGDAAVRNPWRLALAWLERAELRLDPTIPAFGVVSDEDIRIVLQQITSGLNTPQTTSMGRLFDAVSSLSGICHHTNYEAQAAIEMEAIVDTGERGEYSFRLEDGVIDPVPVIQSVVKDVKSGHSKGRIAARFHNAVALMVQSVCVEARDDSGIEKVVLSGGVWQNMVLLQKTIHGLRKAGFQVLYHRQVPANDGGLALGQAAVASCRKAGR